VIESTGKKAPEEPVKEPPPAKEGKKLEIEKFEPASGRSKKIPASVIEKFERGGARAETQTPPPHLAVIEKFERLTPDSSSEAPLQRPVLESFEKTVLKREKEEPKTSSDVSIPAPPERKPVPPASEVKGRKTIEVAYFCPAEKKEMMVQVKENITKIVEEKNINFAFKAVAEILYEKAQTKEAVIDQIKSCSFDFLIAIAPDLQGDVILKEIKKKGYMPKVIAEDNIDKKFRYLNLITDIILSPRK